MDRFQALRIFSTVAESGGFSSAAKRLGISASAVTKAISRLESEFNAQLFRRSTRFVALTSAGQILLQHCPPIIEAMETAENAVNKVNGSLSGSVRIVMPYSFGRVTFAPELLRFRERHTNIFLELHFNDDPTNLVAEGFDLAVLSRHLDDSPVFRRVLVRVPLATAASPAYLEKYGTPAHPAELAQHRCIVGKFGRNWLFKDRDGSPFSIAVQSQAAIHSGDVLREVAATGLGIVQSTWWLFRRDFEQGRLVRLFQDFEVDGYPISVLYPNKKYLSREVNAVLQFLLEITRTDGPND